MKLEQAKPQILPGVITPSKKQAPAKATPLQAKAATPSQLQRSKSKLEQDRAQIQHQAEEASIQRIARDTSQAQARIQRLQDQAAALEQQTRVQRLADTQARQQSFFSSFVKTPVQRKSQQQVKTSSVQTAQARDQYQAAVQPEILQRLVDDRLTLQLQTARASQPQNDLNTRAEWFNTQLPVLRAKHNHPDTPFLDGANVFKPADQQAFTLGKTYGVQRLASGLTPTDAASAILNIQRKADRDIAMRGLLTGVNPRQSDYASIQRLVAQGEAALELQRQTLLEDPAMQSQALQLAKDEANPTSPNSGISNKIKTKLGGGNPLPENVRQQLEVGLNTDLSGVRVHTDSEADSLSKSVQAKAFTTGKDIFFSSGAFDPNTKSGYELIAHETTHTVQQASGQVQPGIDSDPSLETAAQSKGAELASGFNPNFKYKNLENQAQPNSPLIASQPPAHRARIQAMQRSSLLQHQPLQREPQAASPVVIPTVSQTLDESALATLTTALLPVVPQKYQTDAQSNIPVILRQCFLSQIKNANQVAYILATAQHESRFGTKVYSRSESLVEDHNPLQTEHKKVKDRKTGKTTVQDIPYRSNHVTGNRVNADPSNTADLDTYYDNAYGGRLGNVKGSSDAANYRGRGFVQITGRDNYKRLGAQLQNEGFTYTYNNQTYGSKEQPIDLVANPTHVNLVPELAAKIMTSGMQNDSFAQGGKGLSTYVNDKTTDFVGARGLVNGTDRAAAIAKIAEDFAKILNAGNAWGKLFEAPDLTKPSPDVTNPGANPNQVLQRSSLSVQRETKPQSGQTDAFSELKTQVQPYQTMRNSSPNSTALRNYMYGEGKPKWDAAEQKAKAIFASLSYLTQPTPTDRSNILFSIAMSAFFDDSKAQSIFVLGRVLDPQTATNLKNQYNSLQGAEKQTVFGLMNAELNNIPIIQLDPKAIAENEVFGQLSHKFAEFCLYKVMLAKYPDLAKAGAVPNKEANTIDKPQAGINQPGFIEYKGGKELEGSNIRSGPAELGGKALTGNPLPPGTRVFVSGTHPKKPEWYYVTAFVPDGLVRGYVQNFRVTTKLPEPGAVLHFVQQDEVLEPTAAKIYRQSIKPGRDLRFYENATLHVNKEDGRSGVYRGTSRTTGQESVMLQAGSLVWLVSPAFANTLQDIVPSGSITGGAWAKAKEVGRHLEDILSSVTNSPNFFGEVAGEYRDAIMEHLPEIIGITAGFIAAEALSAFLAATPTGVGQLAAAMIQLGLAAFGAKGAIDAGVEALKHAQAWLTSSWTANGDPDKLAFASKEFLKMLVSIALAALAALGARGNIDKGLKIASSIKITPPSIAMMQPAYAGGGGYAAPIPVFQPGSITAAPVAVSAMNPMAAVGAGGSQIKLNPAQEKEAAELREIIKKNEPGSDAHRDARWKLYKLTGGEWDYKRWLNTYEANLSKATTANAGVTAYQQKLGWGKTEVTVDAGGYPRRLDIADAATKRGIEIKEYQSGRIAATEDIRWEVARDKILVADNWDMTWVFIKTKPYQPLIDLLKEAGIKIKYE